MKPLRDYQRRWKAKYHEARARGLSRLLLDAVGGSGKTEFARDLMVDAWAAGGRSLIIENRQQLVEQTARRIAEESGLQVDIEMGTQAASPYAPIVVACAPTIGRIPRLTSFSDDHFSLVFADEAHNSVSNLYLRTMRYFHFGATSLAEDWQQPKDGEYVPKATIIGITATPDTYGKRNLGNFYQALIDRYTYLEAIEDGWLVGLQEHNIPVKIDTRKFRRKTTGHGTDFSAEDESAAIIPVIEELAEQVAKLASARKTMCFLPSKECAMLMSDALNRRGLRSLYVLGECIDRDEKTEEFQRSGPGICLCLCAMYVEGTDFQDVDTVAWMRPTLSPAFYKQGVFRCSRTLPGVVNDAMGPEGRRAAIAASAKPWSMLISPFFVSDKIDIMGIVDLFVDPALRDKIKQAPKEFTDAKKIRDYIESLEKAADKHRNRQPRTINPVSFAIQLGDTALAAITPQTSAEAAPPAREVLDFLLENGINTSAVTSAIQADKLVDRLRERKRLGLATPAQLGQLTLRLHWPEEKAATMSAKQAGIMIGRSIRYKAPTAPSPAV